MTKLSSICPVCAKALRMALAFMLVFFGTLHIEDLAFGAEPPTIYSNEPTDGRISEIVVYEVKSNTDYAQVGTTSADKAGALSISERQGERILFAVASWEDAEGNAIQTDDGKPWRTNASALVDWKINGDIATASKDGDFERVKAAGTTDGKVTLELVVKETVLKDKAGPSLKHSNAVVELTLTNQPEPTPKPDPEPEPAKDPYITSIQILHDDGTPIDSRQLSLDAEQTTYNFRVSVAIKDPEVAVDDSPTVIVECTPEKGLGVALADQSFTSGFVFQDSDLIWSIDGDTAASISQMGVLSATNDGSSFTVRCTTPRGENAADAITVTAGEPAKENPYVSDLQILKTDGSAFAEGEELEVPAPEPSEEGEGSTGATGTYQFQARVTYHNPEDENDTVYILAGDGWHLDGGGAVESVPFSVTWETESSGGTSITPGGLLSMPSNTRTQVRCFTADGKDGQSHESSVTAFYNGPEEPTPEAKVTIGYTPVPEGEQAVLTAQLEGIEGREHSLAWEVSTDQGETWTSTDQTDETITFTTDSEHIGQWYRVTLTVDGMEEPVVSEHVVISAAAGEEPSVSILYSPTAKGEDANLVAEPKNVEGMAHTLHWEESTDNGATWAEVGEADVRTYTVTTDDEHIGRQYRVRLDFDANEGSEAHEPVYSDPVTIREKTDGPSVVIAYNPVPKGQTATLQAVPRNVGEREWKVSWELSKDKGETWEALGQDAATISVPTDNEHIGQHYRVAMTLTDSDETVYSNSVEIKDNTDDGSPRVIVGYIPVPKGKKARLIMYPKNAGSISWYSSWEESTDGGVTWNDLGIYESQTLEVMTDDEHIGRQYRARMDVINPTTYTMISDPATLIEGEDRFIIEVDVVYQRQGQEATFTTDIVGTIPDGGPEDLTYIWEVSQDEGTTWEILQSGYHPKYTVVTDSSVMGNLYRVRARTPQGAEAISSPQMLAATEEAGDPGEEEPPSHFEPTPSKDPSTPENQSPDTPTPATPDTPSDSSSSEEIGDETNPPTDDTPEPPTPDDTADAEPTPQQQQPQQPSPQQQAQQSDPAEPEKVPETMSEMVDTYGQMDMTYDNGATATMTPFDEASAQTATIRELSMGTPKPTLHDVLQDNTFGRLLIPFCLALMAAGATEKYVRYRNQRRPSLAAF